MRVLIIPEDVRLDQYMLKPLFKAMMEHLGKPQAIVEVCQNPRFQGVEQVLKWENLEKVLKQYRQVDLFLICVDRDGNVARQTILRNLEEKSDAMLTRPRQVVFAENAWQEMEVWMLAGVVDWPKDWLWKDVRNERGPKELYFLPYAKRRGVSDGPGQGRQRLGLEAGKRYDRVRRLCPEVQELEGRIAAWLEEGR